MVIEVLFFGEIELSCLLGVLPAALMTEIDRRKTELFDLAGGESAAAPLLKHKTRIEVSGRTYAIQFALGKRFTGEDGRRVQQLWILTAEAA